MSKTLKLTVLLLVVVFAAGYFIRAEYTTDEDVALSTNTTEAISEADVILKTTMGDIEIDLFIEDMPITTGNFLELARSDFYDNVKFHRVIAGFMIQTGDPLTKDESQEAQWGRGGPGYTIEDEFVEGLSNVRGTVAMANTGQPDSGGSQFFINVADNTGLDFDTEPLTSKHPVFGRVISGMDVVDAIASVATEAQDRPREPIVIEDVVIPSL